MLIRLIFSLLKNMFIKIQYLMSFLCVIDITGCKELFTYSSCISLIFRPATIIFMAKIAFSLSSQVLGSEKTVDICRRYNWFPAKWRPRIDNRNSILITCRYPTLDSDTSSVWNFWAPFAGKPMGNVGRFVSPPVFEVGCALIRTKTPHRIKVILSLIPST